MPPPADLVPREETVKVTLSLARRSLDFFKREAKSAACPIPARELRVARVNDHGLINAMYTLPAELLTRIAQAKVVGLCLQWSEEAPVFVGFNNLPFKEGPTKLPGLLALYNRST